MHTLDYILQKMINVDSIIYSHDSSFSTMCKFWNDIYENNELKSSNISPTIKHTLYNFIIKKDEKSNIEFLKSVVDNIFFSENDKNMFFDIFCKAKRIYNAFTRIKYIYKFKKAEIQINHDLYLNPIDISKNNYITILQNDKKYLFTTSDIINIMNSSLSNAPHFFVNPLISKNPYNNIPFNKSTLYNIYFFIKNSNYIMPPLIKGFFMTNFNLHLFVKEYEAIIRDIAIENFIFKSDSNVLYNVVINMLNKYDIKNNFSIHEDFPQEKLVSIMRPYLYLYYMSRFSFMVNKKENAYYELIYKLNVFFNYNPRFGRKYVKTDKITKQKIETFDDKHIDFYSIKKNDFKNSHIEPYRENEFIEEENEEDEEDEESVEEDIIIPLNFNNTSSRVNIQQIVYNYTSNIQHIDHNIHITPNNNSSTLISSDSSDSSYICEDEIENQEEDFDF
jgi:hypothetical protein